MSRGKQFSDLVKPHNNILDTDVPSHNIIYNGITLSVIFGNKAT